MTWDVPLSSAEEFEFAVEEFDPFVGPLSEWLELHVQLPEGLVAESGPLRLYPYQRQIADCIGDPTIERVTLVKSVRVGFTTLLAASMAYWIKEYPSPILIVQPTDGDCRDFMVSDVDASSPRLRNVSPPPSRRPTERSRICHRIFPRGNLKVVSARAPRNLRRHTARILLCDEVDAYEIMGAGRGEGDPLKLAERRTLSFPNRKIICGSTPLMEETSPILRLYGQSDQRIFEVPCPKCGKYTEIFWNHIEWQEGKPLTASFRCPHCSALIDESHKQNMVSWGRWRATYPEIIGHAGFRLNALVSTMANASWAKLAVEFLKVKHDPDSLRVFANTILAQGWKSAEGNEFSEDALMARVERFDLGNIPAEVISITCGIDVQRDRLEVTIAGWTRTNDCLILEHRLLHGDPNGDPDLWLDLDELLQAQFNHPNGGKLKIDAAIIDCADGFTHKPVIAFCVPRTHRKIIAARGQDGFHRAPLARSANRKVRAAGSFWIVGVDAIKTTIFNRLARGNTIRFSDTLTDEWFHQLTSERRIVKYARGKPTARFERIPGRRAEALDCLVYCFAAKSVVTLNLDDREYALSQPIAPIVAPKPSVIRSRFMQDRPV